MATGDYQFRTLFCKGDGGGATDAAQGASDQHYWFAHL
jgi:hypothetical protein